MYLRVIDEPGDALSRAILPLRKYTDHIPERPRQKINVVQGEVKYDSTGFFFVRIPATRHTHTSTGPGDADVADLTRRNYIMCIHVIRPEPQDLANHQQVAGCIRGAMHFQSILQIQCNRLLAKDMLHPAQGIFRNLSVRRSWGCNENRINGGVFADFLPMRGRPDSVQLRVVVPEGLGESGVLIASPDYVHMLILNKRRQMQLHARKAKPDDSDVYGLQAYAPSWTANYSGPLPNCAVAIVRRHDRFSCAGSTGPALPDV